LAKSKKKAKKKATRSPDHVGNQRVAEVVAWMLEGHTRAGILRNASESEWGVSSRSVDSYMKKARAVLDEQFKKDLPHQLNAIIRNLDAIYHRAFHVGTKKWGKDGAFWTEFDYHVARAALMDKAKLLGLVKNTLQIEDEREYEDEKEEDLIAAAMKG
jgi:hypothetical protein